MFNRKSEAPYQEQVFRAISITSSMKCHLINGIRGSLLETEIFIYYWFIFGTYGSKKKQSGNGYYRTFVKGR